MTKYKKKWLILLPLLIAAACLTVYLLRVNRYQKAVREISLAQIDLSRIPDGAYQGECDVDFIRARVEVTVRDGQIERIALLEHHNGRGAAAERIPGRIVEEQRLDVEIVAGATNSSRVIQKAVENALERARQ